MEPESDDGEDCKTDMEVFKGFIKGMANQGAGLDGDNNEAYSALEHVSIVMTDCYVDPLTYDETPHYQWAPCEGGPYSGPT